jgi:hypothetical protein
MAKAKPAKTSINDKKPRSKRFGRRPRKPLEYREGSVDGKSAAAGPDKD